MVFAEIVRSESFWICAAEDILQSVSIYVIV